MPFSSVVSTIRADAKQGVFAFAANTIAGSSLVPRIARLLLLRALGLKIGKSHILPGVYFSTKRVQIGEGAFVNRGCFFDSHGVTLGNRVSLGQHVRFITASHEIGGALARAGTGFSLPVAVGDGTWIGAGATILPGLTIGTGCVIGAGAVVTKDCAPNGLYAGYPLVAYASCPERPRIRSYLLLLRP